MRLLVGFILIVLVPALSVWLLGVGGINQMIVGLTDDPKGWGDIIWGIIRAWFCLPVAWFSAVVGFILYDAMED